jgi:hypothetical protein
LEEGRQGLVVIAHRVSDEVSRDYFASTGEYVLTPYTRIPTHTTKKLFTSNEKNEINEISQMIVN